MADAAPAAGGFLDRVLTWIASAILAGVQFPDIDPRTGEPLQVINQLSGSALANFLASMVNTFVTFTPLGVVLVAMLGVGVSEHSGYFAAAFSGWGAHRLHRAGDAFDRAPDLPDGVLGARSVAWPAVDLRLSLSHR
jgi:p-aminobenzoyl-glutamate transporter AbgT